MFTFYLRKKSGLNNATTFYVRIIQKAIEKAGGSWQVVYKTSEIKPNDIVVTIGVLDAFYTFGKKYKSLINWYQGIAPEQLRFFFLEHRLYVYAKMLLYTFCEKIILKRCALNIFVSDAMCKHFKNKYKYNKDNYFVMPCFNEYIQTSAFTDEKYKKPSFIYTGSSDGWQCIPQMLQLFKEIKKNIPDASLTIFCKDKEKINDMLIENDVEADIRYVPYTQLSEEIKNYKYGFIIREDNPVNNVATPTKMCSYMANGIIPIYSNVIGSFKESLNDINFIIPLDQNNNGLDKLFKLNKVKINGRDVYNDYYSIFNSFFSEEYYVEELSKKMKTFL